MHRLASALDAKPYQRLVAVAIAELLWQYVATYAPQGDIGRWPDDEIARAVAWPGDPELLVAALVATGWLDDVSGCERCKAHRLLVHDWPEHAEDTVHLRLARAGLTFADGTEPRLKRLPQRERDDLLAQYRGLPDPCARQAHGKRMKAHESTLPPPPPPPPPLEDPPDSLTLVGPQAHAERIKALGSAPPRRAAAKIARPRLRRCPPAETLTPERRQLAIDLGLPAARIELEWSKFGDHEFAAARSDWTATWRNWVRTAVDHLPRGSRDEPADPALEARLQAMNSIIQPRKDRSR